MPSAWINTYDATTLEDQGAFTSSKMTSSVMAISTRMIVTSKDKAKAMERALIGCMFICSLVPLPVLLAMTAVTTGCRELKGREEREREKNEEIQARHAQQGAGG